VDFRLPLTIALTLLLTACISPGRSKQPELYLLTAQATPSAETKAIDTAIGVGPVRVAPFLMRPQIVSHDGGGRLLVRDDQRWSEPLEQGIQRVLLQNLAALTQADMRNFPWTLSTSPRYALRVDVIDLDRRANEVTLEAQWMLEDVTIGKLLASHRNRFTAPVSGEDDYAALARGYSELLAQLAEKAAGEIAAQSNR
jgi:uncharacterized lipoprotein YmbA